MKMIRIRLGLTLVELLIVMGILSLLAAVALPNIKTMIKQQRLSRSAADVQAYINAARSKAIGDGQQYGVIIERSGFDSAINRSQSTRLRFAYAPPDYAGDVPEALAVVLPTGNLAFSPAHAPTLVAAAQQRAAQRNGNVVDPIVRPLDQILLGAVGVMLEIQDIRFATANDFEWNNALSPNLEYNIPGFVPDSSGGSFWPDPDGPAGPIQVGTVDPTDAQISGWPVLVLNTANAADFDAAERIRRVLLPGTTVPFKIKRRPRPSILTPLDMTDGTVVDLNYSGIGIGNFTFSPAAIEGDVSGGSRAFRPAPLTAADPPAPDYDSVTIMFDSQGSVSEVYLSAAGVSEFTVADPFPRVRLPAFRQDVQSNIFLLVGRSGNVRPGDAATGIAGAAGPLGFDRAGISNLLDLEAVWIVINRQTGEVFTSNVDAVPRDAAGNVTVPGATPTAVLSNAITISQQSASQFYEGGL